MVDVCLLSRFHGGYRSVVGGWAGDAFISLTGGVAERVDVEDTTRGDLYKRVNNALKCGSVIACSVPVSHTRAWAHGRVSL